VFSPDVRRKCPLSHAYSFLSSLPAVRCSARTKLSATTHPAVDHQSINYLLILLDRPLILPLPSASTERKRVRVPMSSIWVIHGTFFQAESFHVIKLADGGRRNEWYSIPKTSLGTRRLKRVTRPAVRPTRRAGFRLTGLMVTDLPGRPRCDRLGTVMDNG